jgi:hypothetical protein
MKLRINLVYTIAYELGRELTFTQAFKIANIFSSDELFMIRVAVLNQRN